jgi:DNA helicase-2/ATP-dependent DNA helicase PcrA
LNPNDIAKVAIYAAKKSDDPDKENYYRNIINNRELLDKIGVRDSIRMAEVSAIIEQWIGYESQYTIQMVFERILTESGMLNRILTMPESTTRLQVVNTLFNFIKEETATYPEMSLNDLLDTLDKMNLHKIPINIQHVISSSKGINLMTAHGSKGLEFEHVFILNVSEGQWIENRGRNQSLKIPPTIFHTDKLEDLEDNRRLFYVALTRAKNNVYISFSAQNHNDKEMIEARFIHEMNMQDQITDITFSEEEVNEYLATLMQYNSGTFKAIDKDYVDNVIESMYMNATGIRKYLRCKTAFYFENVLRVPMARTNNMGYGNAIHNALEKFVIKMKEDPEMKMPDLETLLGLFKKGMEYFKSHFTPDEYDMSLFNGVQTLTQYYKERLPILNTPRDFRTEYSIKTEYKGIPISGIIDRVDIHDHHVDVTDYKTGSYKTDKLRMPDPDKEDKKYGGEQWFQVVFYKLLLDNDKRSEWKVASGTMDFVQPEKEVLKQKVFTAEHFDTDAAYEQLKETYDGIKSYTFSPGCLEEDCEWCQLVTQNMSLESPLGAGKDEDDNV